MRLPIPCMQCLKEQGHPSVQMMVVEMRDDGLYSAVCEKSHTTITALQQQKFEILFDLGAMALLDGYPKEAITSMAAALERFYEVYVRVICIKHGVDQEFIQKAWRQVENQSERQFGAYILASLLDRNTVGPITIEEVKPTLSGISKANTRTWRAFRNAVVHKGYLPPTDEALAYGNIVFSHINQLAQELKDGSAEHIQRATLLHLSRAHSAGTQQPVQPCQFRR